MVYLIRCPKVSLSLECFSKYFSGFHFIVAYIYYCSVTNVTHILIKTDDCETRSFCIYSIYSCADLNLACRSSLLGYSILAEYTVWLEKSIKKYLSRFPFFFALSVSFYLVEVACHYFLFSHEKPKWTLKKGIA